MVVMMQMTHTGAGVGVMGRTKCDDENDENFPIFDVSDVMSPGPGLTAVALFLWAGSPTAWASQLWSLEI